MAGNSPDESKNKKSSMTDLRDTNSNEKSGRPRFSKPKSDVQDSVRSTKEKTKREGTLRERFHLPRRGKTIKSGVGALSATSGDETVRKGSAVSNEKTKKETNEDSSRRGKTGYGKEYKDLIEKHEATFKFPPGNPMDVRVSKTMTIANLPEFMRGSGIDLGDWIKSINGESVSSRKSYTTKLRKLMEEHKGTFEITYKVDRLQRIQQIKDPQACTSIHQAYEINPGCDYLFAILSLFPGSSLGLSIKSFAGKIFVSSVDNGWKSLAMRSFLVGDAILSVNGQAISSVSEADEKIITELKTKKPVKFVVERAVSPAAVFNVKLALGAEKTVELNPRLMNDVIDICQQELLRMDNNKDGEQLRSILREKKKRQGSAQITFSDSSSETSIGMDPVNPIFLTKAPPRPSAESCRGKKIPRPR